MATPLAKDFVANKHLGLSIEKPAIPDVVRKVAKENGLTEKPEMHISVLVTKNAQILWRAVAKPAKRAKSARPGKTESAHRLRIRKMGSTKMGSGTIYPIMSSPMDLGIIICELQQAHPIFNHVWYSLNMSKLSLQQEVALLRSAVIGIIGKDPEGEYKPGFVESTFAALRRKPTRHFVSARQFLADIARA